MKKQLSISVLAVMSLMACPPTGVVCKPGTLPCGTGCIDPSSDRRHCGACGTTCVSEQDCLSGTCTCRAGTVRCADGTCAATDFDPKNCGQCGVACAPGKVCESGQCKTSCTPGLLRCLASFEAVLRRNGFAGPAGKGVDAACAVYAEAKT